jgi:hypothetical protein
MTDYYRRGLGIVPSLVPSVGHQARALTIRPSCARKGTAFWARLFGTVPGEGGAVQESFNFGNRHEQPFSNSDDPKISTLGRRICAVAAEPEDRPRVRP